MYKVKWRCQNTLVVLCGLQRYASAEAAERQVTIWRSYFPRNTYYVERA